MKLRSALLAVKVALMLFATWRNECLGTLSLAMCAGCDGGLKGGGHKQLGSFLSAPHCIDGGP
jgi:hypothetical protein